MGGLSAAVLMVIGSVISLEGGYVDHVDDTGGATKYGITEEVARSHGYEADMQDLPAAMAEEIYIESYVVGPRFNQMLEVSEPVGHKLIDAGVNAGTSRSSKWVQIALNSLNRDGKDYDYIAEDGKIGPATLSAYKALAAIRGDVKACELILKLLDVQQGYHYMSLKKHKSFTVGWVDNRLQNVPLEACNG